MRALQLLKMVLWSMAEFDRPKIELPPHSCDDRRVGHLIGSSLEKIVRATLIGFPCDDGVEINAGRVGARGAPAAIRERLYRMTPSADSCESFTRLLACTQDRGDLHLSGSLQAKQLLLAESVARELNAGSVPIVLGGGHETTLGHFLGYVRANKAVHLLNIDAHPDVRPRVADQSHSGSSFRDALEHPSALCTGYTVIGLQRHAVASAHVEYLRSHKCVFEYSEESSLERLKQLLDTLSEPALLSIDLDVIDQSQAPGVSAPNAAGMRAEVVYAMAYEAGKHRHVGSLDIVEMNPEFDRDGATARVGALAIWHFLRGLAERA